MERAKTLGTVVMAASAFEIRLASQNVGAHALTERIHLLQSLPFLRAAGIAATYCS